MLGNNRIYVNFHSARDLPGSKTLCRVLVVEETGVTSRDAVFWVVVRYPLFAAEISRLDAQKIILVAVWRHAKILVSADFIVFDRN